MIDPRRPGRYKRIYAQLKDLTRQPVIVPDVEQFPGHIACDPRSKSEIVLPVIKGGSVIAVLDIDSDKPAQFDEDDVAPLTRILNLLQPYL